MKHYMTVLIMVLIAGAALFWQDILAAFAGVSPLEALKTIVTYILHVAIGTVAAVVIFGLPKIVQPWMRTLRWKQHQARRGWRSGPNAQWQQRPTRMPRLTAEQKFFLMMARANGRTRRSAPTQTTPRKLNIKW